MTARIGLLALALLPSSGCQPGGSDADGDAAGTGRVADLSRRITDAETVCGDCLSPIRLTLLGDTVGPGFVVESSWIAVDHAGNFWVGQHTEVKVFDAAGRFVQAVGREGRGPLEFSGFTAPTFTDRDGRVHVIDFSDPRETVIAPDFEHVETRRLPGFVMAAVPLAGGDGYVVNTTAPLSGERDHPLHIIDGADVLYSFGDGWSDADQHPARAQRSLAVDLSGRIISAHKFDYVVETWSSTGELLQRLLGPELNDPAMQFGPVSNENPPATTITGLGVDPADRLWILVTVPKPDWRDHMVEQVSPNGRTLLRPRDDMLHSVMDTRIEIVDLAAATVVARQHFDEAFVSFIENDRVVGLQGTGGGVPQIGIWRIDFSQD